MLHISANFRFIADSFLRYKRVEPEKITAVLDAFDQLDEVQLPKPTPGNKIFENSPAGEVLMNLGTIALGKSAGTNDRLIVGKYLVQFYYKDLDGQLGLADVSENLMY